MLGSVFLHLHPVSVRKSGIRMSYTWCMGGMTFFLFLVETVTGVLLMFYYRPTLEYAYSRHRRSSRTGAAGHHARNSPLGRTRDGHCGLAAHVPRLHDRQYKPPREFNWVVGVILLVLTMLLSFTGYLLPWDQLAIWAITVGSNMARATPIVGAEGPGAALLKLGGCGAGEQLERRSFRSARRYVRG